MKLTLVYCNLTFVWLDVDYWKQYSYIPNYYLILQGMKHVDGAPQEVLDIAHDHWKQFPPGHPAIQHMFGLIFFLLWVISTIGNFLVVFIFLK